MKKRIQSKASAKVNAITTAPIAIKIDKGVPLPPRGSGFRAAMRALKVGDSLLVPDGMMRQNIYFAARAAEIEVAIRSTDAGLRVWRLA